jgi:ATP-dependent DNA ligase
VQKALEQIALPPGTIIDGELLGPRQAGAEQAFFAFDVPILGGVYDRTGTYDERRAWLEASGLPVVDLLPCRPSSFEAAVAAGHEGLVLKRRDSVYPFAASDIGPETVAWLKCKASTTDGRVRR